MNSIIWHNINMLHLLWLLPVLVLLYLFAAARRRQLLARFIDSGMLGQLNLSVSPVRRFWKAVLLLTALLLLILALARPAWNPKPEEVKRRGRDVVFILDVSRSMLANDLAPNRLKRAKLAISDCLEVIEGDRVALVVFAGSSVVKCPLTLDYGFFRFALEQVSTDSISRGGTMIGDALRKVLNEVFDDQEKRFKDIILITDGEDHDSFPEEAAKQAGERGVRLLAIGLGDENEGRRIKIIDEHGRTSYMTHQGREIWTRLDADTLRRMVNATPGGRYLNVGTGAFDLGEVYINLVHTAEKRELESQTIRRYDEKFQIFLGAALLLLIMETMVRERPRRKPELAGKEKKT